MIRRIAIATLIVLVCGARAGLVIAQEPAKQPASPKPTVTALMIDVTLARYLGDKRLSSTPYALSVVPDQKSSLRMGGEVPVPSTTFTPTFTPAQKEGEKPANAFASYGYRRIGTNIDVFAGTGADGQYRITLVIEDNSIYPPDLAPATTKTTGAPAFRGFASNNTIALRDGQTLDYTMATDRLTGEVYRVSVKLTVVK